MKKWWSKNGEIFLLILIMIVGFWLRFWRIEQLEFFTYDQARDAVYIKRIIVDRIPRLLGTQTSLPGMYLPPFYYYTAALFLWLFRLNPVGIDVYAATIGVLTIWLIFKVANKMFGRPAGIISAAVFCVSPLNVELSRRAWNPNTLPFFILLAFYFLWRYLMTRKGEDFLWAVIVYGYSLSLHFGAWSLGPLFLGFWFYHLIKGKGKLVLGLSMLAIFFFVSPLLLFEIRHHFFLLSQAKIFFFDEQHLSLPKINLGESFLTSLVAIFSILYSGRILVGTQAPFEFTAIWRNLFRFSQPISVVAQRPFSLSFQWWGLALFIAVTMISLSYLIKGKQKSWRFSLFLLWLWLGVGVAVTKFYAGKFFFFYYLFLFPAPFLLFGFLGSWLWRFKKTRLLVILTVVLIFIFHLINTTVINKYWRNINDLDSVAKTISEDKPENLFFNVASVRRETDRWDYNAVDYKYFIETFYQKRPLDWLPQDYEKAQVLYLVSEVGQLDPLKLTLMEVEKFAPKKIQAEWQLPKGIVIYKLGR